MRENKRKIAAEKRSQLYKKVKRQGYEFEKICGYRYFHRVHSLLENIFAILTFSFKIFKSNV